MKINKKIIALLAFSTFISYSKMVEYPKDAYFSNSASETQARLTPVIEKFINGSDYYLVEPEKPAIQINPWNKILASVKNPDGKFVFVAPKAYVDDLSDAELEYSIARAFILADRGLVSTPMKALPFLFIIYGLLSICVLFLLFRKYLFASYKKTQSIIFSILLAICVNGLLNFTVMNKVYEKINSYLADTYGNKINKDAMDMANSSKDVALSFLKKITEFIDQEKQENPEYFKVFEEKINNQIDHILNMDSKS